MSLDSEIRNAIREMSHKPLQTQFLCKVEKVNSDMTCNCSPVDESAVIYNVKTNGVINGKGFVLLPKEGSFVFVTMYNKSAGYITMVSEVEQVYINGDNLGGLVDAKELKTQLDKSNAVLNAIYQSLITWVPVPNDGGAALKTILTTALSGLTLGTFVKIENEKIKHGNQ